MELVQRAFEDGDGTGVTMRWNPADPNEIIVEHATGTDVLAATVRPDAEGLWTLRWDGRPWIVQAEASTAAISQLVADLTQSSWFGGLALEWRRALMRMDHIGSAPDDLVGASAAYEQAERMFLSALLAHGVPIGHLEPVAKTVFEATSGVLPHTGLIVPRPGFEVTGFTPVAGRDRAFTAAVSRNGVQVGVLYCPGAGYAVEYRPTAGELHGGRVEMAAFMAASCLPTGRPGDLTPQQFFHLLLTEYEQARQASAYTAEAPRTLLRMQDPDGNDGASVYVVLATGPRTMRRRMPVTPGLAPGSVLRHGTEGTYWTGGNWRPVTFVMRSA